MSSPVPSDLHELPKVENWWGFAILFRWEGFWYRSHTLEAAIAAKSSFQAEDDHVVLASQPKAGTAWLKSLVFCIINSNAMYQDDPLAKTFPHDLIPSIWSPIINSSSSPPKVYHVHRPYRMLPDSIKKIKVYDCIYYSRSQGCAGFIMTLV
ncbi:cytosolic sulfotransferase 13-like [Coffea eugenioides]|uniref:cytosolic sulfotransferase 13-like n=1 Tax=Coffea eugenioides TaxID=49369 RepID=UPI000F605CB7|nr:cytosolic sulfotransferase 13-like [Coffea eugenioides]